jgi:hypothetical protein
MVRLCAVSVRLDRLGARFSRHLGGYCVLAGPGCSAQGAQLRPLLHLQLDLFPACAAYRLLGTRPHSAGVLIRAALTSVDPGVCA